jgi:hypothetical protein
MLTLKELRIKAIKIVMSKDDGDSRENVRGV